MPDSPDETPALDDPDLAAARRVARVAVVAAVALAVALVIALVVRETVGDEPSAVIGSGRATSSGSNGSAVAGDIGPKPGAVIADYVATRQQALAAVADGDERVAVVSFARYRTSAEADSVLTDAGVDRTVTVAARIVAAPGGDPTVVADSLDDWASALRTSAEQDRAQIEQILPTVEAGSEFIPFYQRELVRLAAVRDGADAGGPVVFAFVVEAKGSTLRVLAGRAAVRLVDVGAGGDASHDAMYMGLLPDDTTVTSNPPQRPVPPK